MLSGRLCHPSFCGVFHRGPCFPEYLPPIGQDLRLTIVSTDENDAASNSGGDADKDGGDADKAGHEKPLDSIGEMYAALRACWMPPPKDSARHGMEYTVRFAFKRGGEIMAPPRVTYSSPSGSMSEDGKRGVAEWPKLPRPSSTLPYAKCRNVRFCHRLKTAVDPKRGHQR